MANQSKKNMLKKIYGKRCMLCGERKSHKELTFHHIKPKSHGGDNTLENGALVCEKCQCKIHKYDFLSSQYFDFTLIIINNKIKFIKEKGV